MMFNSLFNYLFGTHNEEIPQKVDDISYSLTSIATEDDWVLVENMNKKPNYTLEESWYITPPSCFPFKEPILMETTSLENLLIEYPNVSLGSVVKKNREQPHINIKSALKSKDVEHSQVNPSIAPHKKENESIVIKLQEGLSPTTSCLLNLGKPNKAREFSQDGLHQKSSNDSNNNNNC